MFNYRVASTQEIVVEQGQNVRNIAQQLLDHELIASSTVFVTAVKALQYLKIGYLMAGEYQFSKGDNMRDVIDRMMCGAIVVRKITLPEGVLTVEALRIINAASGVINDVQDVRIDDINQQGMILPETLYYKKNITSSELLAQYKKQLQEFLTNAWNDRDVVATAVLKNQHEALVLASIVEREARLPSERARIAAVFFNRLKINMPLQADPTVTFAITKGMTFDFKLSRHDLKIQSPYNTYLNTGLPPTPICNPGKASILAVMHPLYTQELYFVVNGEGGHFFSHNFQQHRKNIEQSNSQNHN